MKWPIYRQYDPLDGSGRDGGHTGILHPVFKNLGANGLFIALTRICWISYIGWQVRQDWTKWKKWGFRTDNLRRAFKWPTVLFVVASTMMAWYGLTSGRVLWQGHMLFLLLLYPLWGILQQFLVQALGVHNLIVLFPKQGLMLANPRWGGAFCGSPFPECAADACHGPLGLFLYPVVSPR